MAAAGRQWQNAPGSTGMPKEGALEGKQKVDKKEQFGVGGRDGAVDLQAWLAEVSSPSERRLWADIEDVEQIGPQPPRLGGEVSGDLTSRRMLGPRGGRKPKFPSASDGGDLKPQSASGDAAAAAAAAASVLPQSVRTSCRQGLARCRPAVDAAASSTCGQMRRAGNGNSRGGTRPHRGKAPSDGPWR
mmetsp:Transcript_82641/g.159735  ORF Transcript_82641/g.159735 Transcript_82641/m.159735 type:complete len:188 (-) Transcript_82641:115-678(-)